MLETSLDMKSVSDLLIVDGTDMKYSELNIEDGRDRDRVYAEIIARALENAKFLDTGLEGAITKIYRPLLNDHLVEGVAVKFLDLHSERYQQGITRRSQSIDQNKLQEVIGDTTYYVALNQPEEPDFSSLSQAEKNLAYLAYEHRLHENLYKGYVLPTIFMTFEAGSDILNDKGELFRHRGDLICIAVQDFEGDVRPIGIDQSTAEQFTDWDTLTEQEVANLEKFVNEIERVYLETGYYLDESLLARGNLGLLENGEVVLLDTNVITQNTDKGKIERERAYAEEGIGIGIYNPILRLREQIREYNERHKK
jgi:hypothetical protein